MAKNPETTEQAEDLPVSVADQLSLIAAAAMKCLAIESSILPGRMPYDPLERSSTYGQAVRQALSDGENTAELALHATRRAQTIFFEPTIPTPQRELIQTFFLGVAKDPNEK